MYKLKKNDDFMFQEVRGESVMLNAQTGDYYGLNQVGCDCLRLIDGKKDICEIISELKELYDVDETILTTDIHELVKTLIEKNILIKSET